jgi:shikimate kinase
MKPICFIGLPGSGKSTLGKAVADKLNYDFFDTDNEVLQYLNEPIKNFASLLEVYENISDKDYQKYEVIILHRLMNLTNIIVATGGGLVRNEHSYNSIQTSALCVFLDPPIDLIETRLSKGPDRPMFRKLGIKETLLQLNLARRATYSELAKVRIVPNNNIDESRDMILNELREHSASN